ncbi:hypothetical protein D3877_06295 [Azospirillum cavernae]|uniref:Uncharacterized protein n=1 Tax=Azospirillum cavernae TaxID=2320860 RepID=A0A418W2I2_9PROT|nr:hypothetical protein D3877_06295 [Azospirillum cavernae]
MRLLGANGPRLVESSSSPSATAPVASVKVSTDSAPTAAPKGLIGSAVTLDACPKRAPAIRTVPPSAASSASTSAPVSAARPTARPDTRIISGVTASKRPRNSQPRADDQGSIRPATITPSGRRKPDTATQAPGASASRPNADPISIFCPRMMAASPATRSTGPATA